MMYRKFFVPICLILLLLNIKRYESKNVVTSFITLLKTKIHSEKEVSKIIQMDNSSVCLTNLLNTTKSDCFCSYKKLKQFEKNCASSNFKKNQEDAKTCSEEKCEYCCKLVNSNETSSVSILESELVCEKKCSKSDIILNLNDEDYRTVFKHLIEFIRLFYPANTVTYYPIQNKNTEYTNKYLGSTVKRINEDLKLSENEEINNNIYDNVLEDTEQLFSPYDEN